MGISRASGAVLRLVLVFLGFREEHKLVFRVKVLGLSPGAAPLLFLAGALHTLPGLSHPDDLGVGPTISFRTLCAEPLLFHIDDSVQDFIAGALLLCIASGLILYVSLILG